MSNRIEVDADALYQVLQALIGPGHHIRELQATVAISKFMDTPNPITTLLDEYADWYGKQQQPRGDTNG